MSAVFWMSAARAVDESDWPHRTAIDKSRIVTIIDTHETVLLLDLLRQGKQQKAEDVLFAMLGLRLMEINDPHTTFSAGEQRELCAQLGPLGKLETSKMFESLSHRDPRQAHYLKADIARFKKRCSARGHEAGVSAPRGPHHTQDTPDKAH